MADKTDETNNLNKSWGGRFSKKTDKLVRDFSASIDFDKHLAKKDIEGSIAHSSMLEKIGVLTVKEKKLIHDALAEIEASIFEQSFKWDKDLEDVHMNIEAALTNKIGEIGKKLHTARSRNDQVATDVRLWLKEKISNIELLLTYLRQQIVELSILEYKTIMPGFTHLQVAQPITFGHHLLAWNEMLKRDQERLSDCLKRVDYNPLGSAALAGTSFKIDREQTTNLLGFSKICANSIDAVSDRDFIIEFCSFSSICMMHLSRISEELIIWSSSQFAFVSLDDSFCTGSSIMPQKKNPDIPELVRGKTGRIYGQLMSVLTLMKSQPLAYNRDNQEDKEPLFDTVKTISQCLEIFGKLMGNIEVNRENMMKAANMGYSTATDLADYLVKKSIPFRDAHKIVGEIVNHASNKGCMLSDLKLETLKRYCEHITKDVFEILSVEGSVKSRNHLGGTAPDQVYEAGMRELKLIKEKITKS